MSPLKQLLFVHIGYSAWATRQLLDACSALTLEQLDRGLGASHSSILRTFSHLYDGERVWLDRLAEDGDWRLPEGPTPEYTFEFLVQAWPELWQGYRQWIDSAADGELTHEFTTFLPSDTHLRGPRWQIVMHVVNHSTLHRGQIVTMLRTLRIQPPNTDLMTYYVTS
jgi:uncharacterized damage-inducible protein DinB